MPSSTGPPNIGADRRAWRNVPPAERLDVAHKLIVLHPRFRDAVQLLQRCHQSKAQAGEPAWEKIGQAVDNFTNLFKASVLSWPATKVRDLLTGAGRNMERGVFDTASWAGSDRVYRGHDIPRAAEIPILKQLVTQQGLPLNDSTATRAYKLLYAKLGPGRLNEQADVAGAAVGPAAPNYAGKLDDLLGLIPGGKPTTHWQDVGEFGKTFAGLTPETNPLRFNPLTKDFWAQFTKLRGVDGNTETRLGPVTAMENLGARSDFMNRSVPFLNMLKKGIDPDEAMRRIKDMQVDYDPRTFTPTERTLKRLFPFYAYTSRQLGYVGRELTQNPGGPMGQTIRAINAGRSNDALLPEHIADTAAIPLPARVNDGTKRYLTGLNLMFEDPLSLIGGPQSAGLEVLSRLNPLVKGPLEFITGRSLFQKGPRGGRPLDDLDPTLGRILANVSGQKQAVKTPDWLELILSNSPATRVLSTARQLTDSRKSPLDKAVALGTGVRVSDVSPAAQDAMLQQLLTPLMRDAGAKTFEKVYFSKQDRAAMTPNERLSADKFQALVNTLAKRAKDRKAANQN